MAPATYRTRQMGTGASPRRSRRLVRAYLEAAGRSDWAGELEAMLENHRRLARPRPPCDRRSRMSASGTPAREAARDAGIARYPGIDVTRAVAALAVLVSHLVQTLTWRIPGWEAAAGRAAAPVHAFTGTTGAWGVGLFLVVSGACIHLPLARRMAGARSAPLDTGAFFRRRLVRIYPPYLAALALSAAVAWAMPATLLRSTVLGAPTLPRLATQLLLIHTAVPGHHTGVNGVFWTIALEAQFYALYPLLVWVRRRVGMPGLCAIVLLVAILARVAAAAFLPPQASWPINESFLRRGWEFCLGMWVAERIASDTRTWRVGRIAWSALALVTLLGGLGAALVPGGLRVRAMLWPLLFAVAVESAARWCPGAGRAERAARWLGERSYSLYLVHPIGLAVAIWLLPGWGQARAVGCAVMLLCTAAVFMAFYELVEKRFALSRPPPTGQARPAGAA